MKVILASASPRRKDLMDLAQFDYEIIASNFNEEENKELDIEEQSKEIAFGKAKDIFDNTQGDRIIIGADTLVILDDKQLGKPKDRSEAIKMIKQLQGKTHTVFTAIAVLVENKEKYKEYVELHKVKVFVKKMSESEIERYVDSEDPFDKAGGYAIQSQFSVFIDRIEGDYNTVIGLPIHRIYSILKENEAI